MMKQLLSYSLFFSLILFAVSANAQTATVTDSTNLSVYVGSYTFENGSPVQKYIVTSDKGELLGAADAIGKYKLIKQKADTYKSTGPYGAVITFIRDTNKSITGFSMAVQGTELSAKKDKP